MLFQIDIGGNAPDDVFREFWRDHETDDAVRAFAENLVAGVVARQRDLDAVISGSAENWRLDRMAVVDRNVLRMAVYEMLFESETPPVVAIDEAVEVAKKFGAEGSSGFINGVLDAVRKGIERGEIRPKRAEEP